VLFVLGSVRPPRTLPNLVGRNNEQQVCDGKNDKRVVDILFDRLDAGYLNRWSSIYVERLVLAQ
jgi:hypothetical protein